MPVFSQKCKSCTEYKNCRGSYLSWIFFIIGLIATVAVRLVTVLMHIDPFYGKLSWYVGVGGFFIFFLYMYAVIRKRSEVISRNMLIKKLDEKEGLSDDDYGRMREILCSLSSGKERINYIFIFGVSAVALLVAVYLDLLK
ncbi:MAG: hypothetical protein JXJ19_01470 [Elusimicrobia bacterium]|nr:hypothetical protein [Elusimicrobiota bacterium]